MNKEVKKLIKNKTKVYSIQFGAGEIVGISKMYDGIRDHIEVKFSLDKNISHFPIGSLKKLRTISSSETLTKFLTDLSRKVNNKKLTMGTNTNNLRVAEIDLLFIINTIAKFSNEAQINENEKELFSLCIDSLILEVSDVFQVNVNNARGIVSDYMQRF